MIQDVLSNVLLKISTVGEEFTVALKFFLRHCKTITLIKFIHKANEP